MIMLKCLQCFFSIFFLLAYGLPSRNRMQRNTDQGNGQHAQDGRRGGVADLAAAAAMGNWLGN
jgi:hypothetical protein